NYPTKSVLTFGQIPMLKPVVEKPPEKKPEPEEGSFDGEDESVDESNDSGKFITLALWGILGVLGVVILLLWQRLRYNESAIARAEATQERERSKAPTIPPYVPWPEPPKSLPAETKAALPAPDRAQLLHLFLARPHAFRLYYD